jgi:hypothetical protein
MLPDTFVFASAMPSAADAEFSRYRAVDAFIIID